MPTILSSGSEKMVGSASESGGRGSERFTRHELSGCGACSPSEIERRLDDPPCRGFHHAIEPNELDVCGRREQYAFDGVHGHGPTVFVAHSCGRRR
jgi:hypothetical protein